MEENFNIREVLEQLKGIRLISDKTPIKLPFPERHLVSFLQTLKYFALLTERQFLKEKAAFVHRLPLPVISALHCELFQLAIMTLLEKLRSPASPA